MKKMTFSEFMKRDENKEKIQLIESYIKPIFENDEKEEDDEMTDEKIEKEAKSKDKGDEELEKEVEKEAKEESEKEAKKVKKILIGVVTKEKDGEVLQATVYETDAKEKKIEGVEYFDDLFGITFNPIKLKTPAEIAKHLKKINGTVIYWFDFDKKDADKEYLKIEKIK